MARPSKLSAAEQLAELEAKRERLQQKVAEQAISDNPSLGALNERIREAEDGLRFAKEVVEGSGPRSTAVRLQKAETRIQEIRDRDAECREILSNGRSALQELQTERKNLVHKLLADAAPFVDEEDPEEEESMEA